MTDTDTRSRPGLRGSRLFRWMGILALLGIVVGGSVAQAAAVPLFASADEIGHFDYAYQVWHGHLPNFYQGVVVHSPKGNTIPVQWVSQHPPLFYLVLSPIVGPLTDAGHILVAGMLARAVTTVFGCLTVLAVVWAVRQAFPGRARLAYCAGLVAASASWLHGVAGAVYNDSLAALFAALMIGVTAGMVRSGPRKRSWWLFALILCGAGLTRLSLLAIAFICLVAVSCEGFVRGRGRDRWGRWTSLALAFLSGVLILATSGWFYLRNYRLTGSITGGHPEWSAVHLHRVDVPFGKLASSRSTWAHLFGIFGNNGVNYWTTFELLILVPLALAVILGAVHLIRALVVRDPARPRGSIGVLVLLAVIVAVVTVMQLDYSTGGGGVIPRYTLPILMPIAVVIAAGLTLSRPLSYILVPVWALAAAGVRLLGPPTFTPSGHDFPTYATASHLGMALCLVALGAATVHALALESTKQSRSPSPQA